MFVVKASRQIVALTLTQNKRLLGRYRLNCKYKHMRPNMGLTLFSASMVGDADTVLHQTTSEGVTTITINRPNRRNAVDGPTSQKLFAAFKAFEADISQKVCVFAGAGGTFCAGADLHDLAGASAQFVPGQGRLPDYVDLEQKGPMGPSRMQVSKPVIAAVTGYAVAGGLELSLLADMRVAEEDTVFGVFCRRWGVPLVDGGTVRLQQVVGLGRALDLILTGRPVDAGEAMSMGLANRVVPKGQAMGEAMKIAKQLLQFPQECMNKDRDNCYYSAYGATSFKDAMSREFREGIQVLEKESMKGAGKFSEGAGRHGSYELRSKI